MWTRCLAAWRKSRVREEPDETLIVNATRLSHAIQNIAVIAFYSVTGITRLISLS